MFLKSLLSALYFKGLLSAVYVTTFGMHDASLSLLERL